MIFYGRIRLRTVKCSLISEKIAKMCIDANTHLTEDIENAIHIAQKNEISENGQAVLEMMQKNIAVANRKQIPICQDTGMVVVFVTIGQDLHIEGGGLEEAINEGVARGYEAGYLRKSVVEDPIIRTNTKDNTPAVIYYKIVKGERLHIKIMPKGFGSENTSDLKMLKPSDGMEGVENFIYETIKKAAPNACPPIIVGVGVGGTFEKSALMAKEALSRPLGQTSEKEHIKNLEERLLKRSNALGIGPMGLGGLVTVLGINIDTYPTHIAGLPVAVNVCCYLNRHREYEF